jgi:hypothetical protein
MFFLPIQSVSHRSSKGHEYSCCCNLDVRSSIYVDLSFLLTLKTIVICLKSRHFGCWMFFVVGCFLDIMRALFFFRSYVKFDLIMTGRRCMVPCLTNAFLSPSSSDAYLLFTITSKEWMSNYLWLHYRGF